MAMYEGAQTVVRTTGGDSKAFNVKVGLHQGSVLSHLLFLIVMEMISREQSIVANVYILWEVPFYKYIYTDCLSPLTYFRKITFMPPPPIQWRN